MVLRVVASWVIIVHLSCSNVHKTAALLDRAQSHIALSQSSQAWALLDRVKVRDEVDAIDRDFLTARLMISEGDFSDAVTILERIQGSSVRSLRFRPDDVNVLYGIALYETGSFHKCAEVLGTMERSGMPIDAHLALAKCFFENGQYNEAVSKFSGLMVMDSMLVEPYIGTSVIYYEERVYDEVILNTSKGMRIHPDNARLPYLSALAKIATYDSTACNDLRKAYLNGMTEAKNVSVRIGCPP